MFFYKVPTSVYFPKHVYLNLISLLWIVQPVRDEKCDLSYLQLLSFRLDPKTEFRAFMNYPNLWVFLLSIPDIAISVKKRFLFLFACQQSTFASKDFLLMLKLNQKIKTHSRMFIWKIIFVYRRLGMADRSTHLKY